ncbi:glycosyltransferase family 2 protein [Pseudomonadota bacterium]
MSQSKISQCTDRSKLDGDPEGLSRIDNNELGIKQHEILVFSCVRNELSRLPYFFEYHRALGANRFFVIDNASTDGTTDFLLTQSDVHLFFTAASYAKSRCGVDWLNSLLAEFGTGYWTITLDVDELLVYPGSESIKLQTLVNYLESENAEAVGTFLLDMYSDLPISKTDYIGGSSFIEICKHFDGNTYLSRNDRGLPVRGGPRHRLFWQGKNRAKPPPVLTKYPLIRWREGLSYTASTHILPDVKLAQISGVLLHFKLFSDFIKSCENEAKRNEHWDDAAQYKIYWEEVQANPDLTAYYEDSIAYTDSMQLVKLRLMECPQAYLNYIAAQ